MASQQTLNLIAPDDMHLHLRDHTVLDTVVAHSAREFARAMVMPNLSPPITTVEQALDYRQRIITAASKTGYSEFQPLMSLYLTDNTPIDEIKRAADTPQIVGAKLYPAGATTNSDSGVTRISAIMPVLEAMADSGLVLQVHGEVTDAHIDLFDREAVFIEQVLAPLCQELPTLKVVLEHVTTEQGVEFVRQSGSNIAATLTAHHLLFDRNALFQGGIRPHYYCLPVLKRAKHREALISAAISGDPSFFLGTDSAPHPQHAKESACGCAGIYTAHAAMPLYAQLFEQYNALDRLENFSSRFGAAFYGLAINTQSLSLSKSDWTVPTHYALSNGESLIPLMAGEQLSWQLDQAAR